MKLRHSIASKGYRTTNFPSAPGQDGSDVAQRIQIHSFKLSAGYPLATPLPLLIKKVQGSYAHVLRAGVTPPRSHDGLRI